MPVAPHLPNGGKVVGEGDSNIGQGTRPVPVAFRQSCRGGRHEAGMGAGTPRLFFEGQFWARSNTIPAYDVAPDGQRLLVVRTREQQQESSTQINVVLNWFEELKQRVPVN